MAGENEKKTRMTVTFEQLVLFVILFAVTFLPADLFSPILVLTGFSLLMWSLGKINTKLLKIILPLLAIFIVGLTRIFGHDSRHVFRDISYALTPVSLLYTGFWISGSRNIWPGILKILILGGILIACIHIFKFLINPDILSQPISDIRLKAQNPNVSLVGLTMVLGIFQKWFKSGNLFPRYIPGIIALPILITSFVLSFSRTGIVLAIVMAISLVGWVGRINLKAALTITILFIVFILVLITTPKNDITTFRGKIARSLIEITISDYKDYQDINNNWRGYETYRAVHKFASGSPVHIIFGYGFGSLVDLGMTMNLSGVDFTEIPILHNGYAYILVKTGLFGILCYLFFYISLIRTALKYKKDQDSERAIMSRLLLGCLLCLILSMYVVGGMAEIHNSEYVLLIGFIIRRFDNSDSILQTR
jgi:O-antigen ligase